MTFILTYKVLTKGSILFLLSLMASFSAHLPTQPHMAVQGASIIWHYSTSSDNDLELSGPSLINIQSDRALCNLFSHCPPLGCHLWERVAALSHEATDTGSCPDGMCQVSKTSTCRVCNTQFRVVEVHMFSWQELMSGAQK